MNTIFIPDLWEEKQKETVNIDFSNYATKTDLNNFLLKNTVIDMNNNRVTNLGDPNSNKDAVTKDYNDFLVSSRVNKAGDMMNGTLDMNSNRIIRVGDPTKNDHAANMKYVDQCINRTSSSIPFLNVWQYNFSGSENVQVSYRRSVHELRDERFRNIAARNVLLFASCTSAISSHVDLTAAATVVNVNDDIITINIHVENQRGLPWTNDYIVFLKAIIFPTQSVQKFVRSVKQGPVSEQTAVYPLSTKTLKELTW